MTTNHFYTFEDFRFDPAERTLEQAGKRIPLTPKAYEVLQVLVEAGGKAVSKQELLSAVWPETFVDEATLVQNIATLRKALGRNESGDGYIETLPKLGYRFRVPVTVGPAVEPAVVPPAPAEAAPRRMPRRMILAAGALAPVAAGAVWLWRRRQAPAPPLSVVVLPVLSLSEEAGDKLVADSLTEEITHSLVSTDAVRVVARTSAYRFASGARDVRAIAQDLRADAVLEGSLRRLPEGYRVTAQLIRGEDGYHTWSRVWNPAKGEVFGVAPEIAAGIAQSVSGTRLAKPAKPLTSNGEALLLYVRARSLSPKVFHGSLETAIGLLRQALTLEPNFAEAHALLAHCYAQLGFYHQRSSREVYPQAEEAIAAALRIDPENAFAHTVRGDIEMHYRWRWPEALQSLERGIALDPQNSHGHHILTHYYLSVREKEKALQAARRTMEFDPLDPTGIAHLAWTQLCFKESAAAIQTAEQGLKLDPEHFPTLLYLQWALELSGDVKRVIDVRRRMGTPPGVLRDLETGAARDGFAGYARAQLEHYLAPSPRRKFAAYGIAGMSARIGKIEQALEWLEIGYAERLAAMAYIGIDCYFDSIRDDPRFQRIVARVGIPG